MKIPAAFFLLVLFSFISCKSKDSSSAPRSENSMDAARNFIRAALDGKFQLAATYMVNDSANLNWLDVAERSYQKADQSIKDGYRAATINFIRMVEPVKDSVTLLIYANSFYRDNHDTLKLLKVKDQWLVDLKYLFNHDTDTIYLKDIMDMNQNKIK